VAVVGASARADSLGEWSLKNLLLGGFEGDIYPVNPSSEEIQGIPCYKTLSPEMRLCADLSHFVVDRELRAPVRDRDQRYITSILDRSDCFQGRVASREQVQVAINFTQHQDWVEIFRGWWKYGMREWRHRNPADATLAFLCELGPPPYAITDGDQRELSDRW